MGQTVRETVLWVNVPHSDAYGEGLPLPSLRAQRYSEGVASEAVSLLQSSLVCIRSYNHSSTHLCYSFSTLFLSQFRLRWIHLRPFALGDLLRVNQYFLWLKQ